jgi:kinesin family protein 2/24
MAYRIPLTQGRYIQLENYFTEAIDKEVAKHKQQVQSGCKNEDPGNANVFVYLRTRPLLPNELSKGQYPVVSTFDNNTLVHEPTFKVLGNPSIKTHLHSISSFGPTAKNKDIYENVIHSLLRKVMEQKHGSVTVLAYGQTGSGKTYTINALLMRAIEELTTENIPVAVSAVEIKGQLVKDLLNGQRLQVSKTKFTFMMMLSLTWVKITPGRQVSATFNKAKNFDHLLQIIETALACRSTASTLRNDESSRSHAIYTLVCNESVKMVFVDLAGSERNADQTMHDLERAKEARLTNQSLSVLKDCLRGACLKALTDGKKGLIPWRNSALTITLKGDLTCISRNQRVLTKIIVADYLFNAKFDAYSVFLGMIAPGVFDVASTLNTTK